MLLTATRLSGVDFEGECDALVKLLHMCRRPRWHKAELSLTLSRSVSTSVTKAQHVKDHETITEVNRRSKACGDLLELEARLVHAV